MTDQLPPCCMAGDCGNDAAVQVEGMLMCEKCFALLGNTLEPVNL